MDVFPNAKVILTSRYPERWYKSAKNSIMEIRKSASFLHVQLFLQMTGGYRVYKMVDESSNMKPKGCLQKGNVVFFQFIFKERYTYLNELYIYIYIYIYINLKYTKSIQVFGTM